MCKKIKDNILSWSIITLSYNPILAATHYQLENRYFIFGQADTRNLKLSGINTYQSVLEYKPSFDLGWPA